MRRLIGAVTVALALVSTGLAFGQAFKPTAGVKYGINLYAETRFRNSPTVITGDTPRVRRPIEAQSVAVLRGVWELCSDIEFGGRCVTVSETQEYIHVALVVRSARLVGDNGPNYSPLPTPRAGPDLIMPGKEKPGRVAAAPQPRAEPAPVVAPPVAQGGLAGVNPSLKGTGVEFFAAPARNGLRVLACGTGKVVQRCVEATADGFCIERGYRESTNQETDVVAGQTYLSNVLCKAGGSPAAAAAPPPKEKKKGLLGRVGL